MNRIKMVRLEFHDDNVNSHKFYEVFLDQLDTERFKIYCNYGRCKGHGIRSASMTHLKDVVGSVVQALVVFHDWVNKKAGKGYKIVSEG